MIVQTIEKCIVLIKYCYFTANWQKSSRLCVLRSKIAYQQENPDFMHGKPWTLHEEEEARHDRGPADEGPEQGGEAGQAAGEGEAPEGDCCKGEGREDAGKCCQYIK